MTSWLAVAIGFFSLVKWGLSLLRGVRARRKPRWQSPQAALPLPAVSVIVPAWRERGMVELCIEALRKVDYPDFEVLLVAGGPDGTYDAVRAACADDPRLRVIEQQPGGKGAALNRGVAATSCPVVVLLDADTIVTAGWLRGLVASLQADAAAAVGNYFPLRNTPVALYEELLKTAEYEVRGRVILQGSGSIAIWRDALQAAGAFPETQIADDWDLDGRLAARGMPRVFAPAAVVSTERPATLREWRLNELRWRRLHLVSLFKLREHHLRDPLSVARQMYPYALAWAAFFLAAGGLMSAWRKFALLRRPVAGASLMFVSWLLSGKLGTVIEVIGYTRRLRWVRVIPIIPGLTAAELLACGVASITTRRAALQFKGPRQAFPVNRNLEPAPERMVQEWPVR